MGDLQSVTSCMAAGCPHLHRCTAEDTCWAVKKIELETTGRVDSFKPHFQCDVTSSAARRKKMDKGMQQPLPCSAANARSTLSILLWFECGCVASAPAGMTLMMNKVALTVDIVTEDLAVTLGTALSEALSSLAASRQVC